MRYHLISFMVLIPILGALIQAVVPGIQGRWAALVSSLAGSACGIALVLAMQSQQPELQLMETLPWVGSYAISYEMGIDGLNVLLVLLLSVLFPILIASEWDQKVAARGMHGLFLILQTALMGAVCSQDLFLMFFFWALSSLPFYFLIGIWGGKERESASTRSMVTGAVGNAFLFGALLLVYYAIDPHTFSLRDLAGGKLTGKTMEILGSEFSVTTVSFVLVCAGLALRAPIWPFHGWFVGVAKEAPFSVFVSACGGAAPVAAYLFIRLCYTLFPETLVSASHAIVVIGVVNLLIAGICAAAQKGLRLLLAFLCIAEMGMVLIGIGSLNQAGIVGAIYQQLVFGLGLAGFGLFSALISERAGHVDFLAEGGTKNFGGIATKAPLIALVAGIVIASILGFPGLGGFVGHALLIIGSYSVHPVTVVMAGAALLLATYYLFAMYRSIFLGDGAAAIRAFPDLTLRERAYLFPLITALIFLGLYPKPLLDLVRPTALALLSTIK